MARVRGDTASVRCPYCLEKVDLFVDPETEGAFVEDCSVCCRPWAVVVSTGVNGARSVVVDRTD